MLRLRASHRHQGCLELPVKKFDQAVGDRVVGSGQESLDVKETGEVFPQSGLKLPSMVHCNCGRHTEARDPTTHKGSAQVSYYWPGSPINVGQIVHLFSSYCCVTLHWI